MTSVVCKKCGAKAPEGHKFCGTCGHKLEWLGEATPVAAHPMPPGSAAPSATRDQRRDVTVLFADLSGYTAMSEQMDPEAVHDIMNACFEGLAQAIHEQDGHIDKYIGDNVMALFGAPIAHEDDPLRAARAALAMQSFLHCFSDGHKTTTGGELKMRIGIHCGLVLAGGVGAQARRDYSVVGDTVNTASRLESAALPGSILVSYEVMRRTSDQLRYGPGQQVRVKGKQEPINAYSLQGELTPFDVAPWRGAVKPLFGRDAEIATLLAWWGGAKAAPRAPWIEIRGPMGIGKTSLVEAAAARAPKLRLLKVVARPTQRRPYAFARRILHAVAHHLSGCPAAIETRKSFLAVMAAISRELRPFHNALWYLAAPDGMSVPAPDPDPETLRKTLDRGIARLLTELAATTPDLVLFLDAYDQTDPASERLLRSLSRNKAGSYLPIILNVRDDFCSPARSETVIHIGPLQDEAAAEVLEHLVDGCKLPHQLRQDLLKRAGGVPLFIEEMVRELIDKQVLVRGKGNGGWESDPQASAAILPGTLRSAMTSRLDRLEAATHDLICQCAVQGVEFNSQVARSVWDAGGGVSELFARSLQQLRQSQLISPSGTSSNCWIFTQHIMQSACYSTLARKDRRQLHAAIAGVLARVRGANAASPEVLAHHYENGEMWQEAALANLRAGERAAELFSNEDAVRRFGCALAALGKAQLPAQGTVRTAYLAHRGAARVHLRIGAYGDLRRHAQQMLKLAPHDSDKAEALRLSAAGRLHTGRLDEAERLLLDGLDILRQDGAAADETKASILHDLANLYHREGRNEDARAYIERSRALRSNKTAGILKLDMLEGRVAHVEGRFKQAVVAYERAYRGASRIGSLSEQALSSNNMGNAARDVGDYEKAHHYYERALEIWQRTGTIECMAGAHNNLANIAMSRGQLDLARRHHQQSLAAFRQIKNVAGKAMALTNLAILAIEAGAKRAAVARAERALTLLRPTGNRVLIGLTAVVLGEAQLENERCGEAEQTFSWVLREFSLKQHPLAIAGALRGLGRVFLGRQQGELARSQLERALELFERLERNQEAARTQIYLARAWQLIGQPDGARTILECALARFRSMGADRDARAAQALLRRTGERH